MRLMRQFGIIAAMTCIGELMHYFIPLPVPGSIYGLLLMLAALMTGIVKLEQVKETAEFLIDVMPLMFIPAGVGLMTAWGQLRQILLPVTIITFVSTVAVMGVTGRVTELLLAVTARGRAKGETAAAELKEELLAEKAVLKAELGELASREAEKVKELVEEAEETVRNSADEKRKRAAERRQRTMNEVIQNSTIIGIVISLLAFEIGVVLRTKLGWPVLNPLLISIILVIAFMVAFRIDYNSYILSARYLSYLLTPATVALAVPLYQQMQLLKDNFLAVMLGVLSGVLTSLGSILLLCLVFRMNHVEYITLLPKSITTAIGMSVVEELGGYTTITVATIIVTGILGNVLAEPICHLFAVKSPIAKGLALGTSAHAIGTSKAMQLGEVEGAMASLAIVVCGIMTVVGASVFANFL